MPIDGGQVYAPAISDYPFASEEIGTPSVRSRPTEDIYLTFASTPAKPGDAGDHRRDRRAPGAVDLDRRRGHAGRHRPVGLAGTAAAADRSRPARPWATDWPTRRSAIPPRARRGVSEQPGMTATAAPDRAGRGWCCGSRWASPWSWPFSSRCWPPRDRPVRQPVNSPLIGKPAPAIQGPSLTGGPAVQLSSLEGKWVLVNFAASWCIPCRQETPQLLAFAQDHGQSANGQSGNATIVTVAYDEGDVPSLTAFLRSTHSTWPAVNDGQAVVDYGVGGHPRVVPGGPRRHGGGQV